MPTEPNHAYRNAALAVLLAATAVAGCTRREEITTEERHELASQELTSASAARALEVATDGLTSLSVVSSDATSEPETVMELDDTGAPVETTGATIPGPGSTGAEDAREAPRVGTPRSATEAAEHGDGTEHAAPDRERPIYPPSDNAPKPIAPTAPAETKSPLR